MENKIIVKDSRIYSLVVLFDMYTTYFNNVLDAISDKDAHNRLNTKANHIAWITGSLVQERYEGVNAFGKDLKQSAHELFKDHQGIKDGITYPSLQEFKKDWEKITPQLRDTLINLTDKQLDASFEMMPGMTITYFDLITFMAYREANCIGQIALWRRLLGYEPMKYM